MHWSYRILEDEDGLFNLKEIHFDTDGIWGFSADPIDLGGFETKEDLIEDLALMLEAVNKHEVLNEATVLKEALVHPHNLEVNKIIERIESGEEKLIPIEKIIEDLEGGKPC